VIIIAYYSYLGLLSLKNCVFTTFDSLYAYFLSFFSLLQTMYDLVLTIPDIVADFFQGILDDIIGGATDLWPF
jgi:hypothetical protein